MSTAGGVVFSPEEFGQFTALESKSGKVLWHFNTGDVITDSPISYSVDGKQYVAVSASGGGAITDPNPSNTESLYVFALP